MIEIWMFYIRRLTFRLTLRLTFRLTFLAAFLTSTAVWAEAYVTPTEKVADAAWPKLADDLGFRGMDLAITRQLKKFNKADLQGTIRFGSDVYSLASVKDSLVRFQQLITNFKKCTKLSKRSDACGDNLTAQIKKYFNLYRPHLEPADPRFGEAKATFFTGYYTPLLTVSKTLTPEFSHAIYATPVDKKLRHASRDEIDFKGALNNQGAELYYANDLFDLYLMHVEGGSHLLVKNGKGTDSQYISYDSENGLKFQFIEKFMMAKGWIKEPTIKAQREFFKAHPELQEEGYSTCPSYVFYKLSPTPPLGSGDVPLTDNRSIATDTAHYRFKGTLSFVSTARPEETSKGRHSQDKIQDAPSAEVKFKDYSRFYLDQDTGGAIRGKARVDLYFGEGAYAEYAASNEIQRGDLYFLMLKQKAH